MIKLNKQYKEALKDYKFIDLFCGIGGFHLALSSFGAKCVLACDIDEEARKVYKENFKIEPKGDIKEITKDIKKNVPNHDILCGGFPCQAFSISGHQAGFNDKTTGKLFDEIIKIAEIHKPKFILLENVANLEKHDGGKTIETIEAKLKETEYIPCYKILDASDYNIPQCRKRIYIIAFHKDMYKDKFDFPENIKRTSKLKDFLDKDIKEKKKCYIKKKYKIRKDYIKIEKNCKKPYIRIGEIGEGRQGERIYSVKGCSTTLSSSSGGLGGRTGLYYINEKLRKLTPRECARLMGFPDSFKIADTHNQAYKQFGNSVVVDVLQYIILKIIIFIMKEKKNG
jgi:DNA (cytosine-5)-methyltransferase 1